MSWNYRMFHREVNGEDEFTIREAYYDDNGDIHLWSADPSFPSGETKIELMDDLARMLEATGQPVVKITPDGEELLT
jgi:hypothetical protein